MRRFTASLLLATLCLGAQQQPPAQVPAGMPKFSTTAQLVVEIVTAKDKNGNPILGLTAKDFVVTENGKPQTVSFCEFQKVEDAAPDAAPAPVIRANVDPATRHQIMPEQPGDVRYRDRRLLALYFDMSAMPQPDH